MVTFSNKYSIIFLVFKGFIKIINSFSLTIAHYSIVNKSNEINFFLLFIKLYKVNIFVFSKVRFLNPFINNEFKFFSA